MNVSQRQHFVSVLAELLEPLIHDVNNALMEVTALAHLGMSTGALAADELRSLTESSETVQRRFRVFAPVLAGPRRGPRAGRVELAVGPVVSALCRRPVPIGWPPDAPPAVTDVVGANRWLVAAAWSAAEQGRNEIVGTCGVRGTEVVVDFYGETTAVGVAAEARWPAS